MLLWNLYRNAYRNALRTCGFDNRDWARIILYEECDRFIRGTFDLRAANVLAISSNSHFDELGFTHFTTTSYPDFDICHDILNRKFDLIIADQVFEHLKFPARAARNVHQMLEPNGWFILTTPFLIKIHPHPIDCSRWTVDGIKYFLAECGFGENDIMAQSWGNRAYISWHLWLPDWPRRGFSGSLKNEADFPVVVWAFAQKKAK